MVHKRGLRLWVASAVLWAYVVSPTASLTISPPIGERTAAFPTAEATTSLVPTPIHVKDSTVGEGGVEYICYDQANKKVFAVNPGSDTLDSYVVNGSGHVGARQTVYGGFSTDGYKPQSCAVNAAKGVVVVAAEAGQNTGKLYSFKLSDGSKVGSVDTGALPDHTICSSDGSFCATANEGEPSDDLTTDPVGGITIVTASDWTDIATYSRANHDLTGVVDETSAISKHVHRSIPNPTTTFDNDLEPEYLAMSASTTASSGKLYASLQENNAIIEFDMATRQYTKLIPLGWKALNILQGDYSDKDSGVVMRTMPSRVVSMYQPDSIMVVTQNGVDYLIMANEGDSKDYSGFSEEARAKDLTLNSAVFSPTDISSMVNETVFGRMKVSTQAGKTSGASTHDYVVGYGGRSFSVVNLATGAMVWDSEDQISKMEQKYWSAGFQSQGSTSDFDSRSDDKGAEPESLAYGVVGGTPYVFVGLERTSLIGAWDITDITNPVFAGFGGTVENCTDMSLATNANRDPEAMHFVPAESSPTGEAMLIAGGSVTGTLSTFRLLQYASSSLSGDPSQCMLCPNPLSCGLSGLSGSSASNPNLALLGLLALLVLPLGFLC